MNYKVIIYYDEDYKGYYVDVPQLPGCMSQGKTIDLALENVRDAIKGWLVVEKKFLRLKKNNINREIFLGEVTV